MCRKTERSMLQAFLLPSGTAVALGLLILLFGVVLDATAQQSTGQSSAPQQEDVRDEKASSFVQFIPKGYSKEGPFEVVSATTEEIKFYSGRLGKPRVLKLTGTQVSVRNEQNDTLSFSSLVKGVNVYVSRSPDKKIITIFVVPATRKENKDV